MDRTYGALQSMMMEGPGTKKKSEKAHPMPMRKPKQGEKLKHMMTMPTPMARHG